VESVWYDGDAVGYLDQRALPQRIVRERASSVDEVIDAIRTLAVRGAPAIGIFGAYGVALAAQLHSGAAFDGAAQRIREARPTAVNLAYAVDRVLARADRDYLAEANAIHAEQRDVDARIGRFGAEVLPRKGNVMTHCNAGPIATGGEGTALAAIIAAHRAGKALHVYVDETRPLLQGARLTMFELREAGVPCTLIPIAPPPLRCSGRRSMRSSSAPIGSRATRYREQDRHVRRRDHRRAPRYPVLRRSSAHDVRFRHGLRMDIPIEDVRPTRFASRPTIRPTIRHSTSRPDA